MAIATFLAVSAFAQQPSVLLRVTAPPDTKYELRTTTVTADDTGGTLEASYFMGVRILSNVRSSYRCRVYVASARANAAGTLRSRAAPIRTLAGWTADLNCTALNAATSIWRNRRQLANLPLSGLGEMVYPEFPVTVGSSWTAPQMVDGRLRNMELEVVGFGMEGQGRTILIEGRIAEGQGLATIEPHQFVIDVSTGLLRRASGKWEFVLGEIRQTTAFRTVRASLIIPPPKVLNRPPVKRAAPKSKPKPPPRRRGGA